MRSVRLCAALALALPVPLAAFAATKEPPRPTVQSVLTPASARAANLGHLGPCVAVTPDGAAVIGTAHGLSLVGGGRARATGVQGLSCFTFTPEGLLMGVQGRELVYLDPHSRLRPLFRLPDAGMTIVPGQGDSLLLFGREGGAGWGLYTIRPGRRVARVLISPKPIAAAAETAGRILVVADGALFAIEGGRMRLLAGEPKGRLTAVAADPAGKAVFVSDGRRIFRMENGRPAVVTDDLGGNLRWQGGGLLVFDRRRPVLVRLMGVE